MIPTPSSVLRSRTMALTIETKGPSRVPLTLYHRVSASSIKEMRPADAVSFCLHPKRVCSPAGAVCSACGEVVASVNEMIESRGAVVSAPLSVPSERQQAPHPGAWEEWHQQTNEITTEQPEEIIQNARELFSLVYARHGQDQLFPRGVAFPSTGSGRENSCNGGGSEGPGPCTRVHVVRTASIRARTGHHQQRSLSHPQSCGADAQHEQGLHLTGGSSPRLTTTGFFFVACV